MAQRVLKVGGHELDDAAFVAGLIEALKAMPQRPILVHGGGKEISQLSLDLGLSATFVSGMRVTDAATLRIAVMVMAGLANKRLVAAMDAAGIPALGVSAVDLGLVRVTRWIHPSGNLGYVGRVVSVNTEAFERLLALDAVIVMSPIAADDAGQLYNVNADHIAQAVARSLGAGELVFVTNVPGVLRDGELLPHLTAAEAEGLIRDGVVAGGMIAKVRAALDALNDGVATVRIVNLASLADGGTAITESVEVTSDGVAE
ncbi:MAG: acetylglutamate kinase [Anaerolineae bacterium]